MKTILHFFSYDMTKKVRRPGFYLVNGVNTPLPSIAPAGYYTSTIIADSGVDEKHMYYHGVENETIGKSIRDIEYKDSWKLLDNESVFEY